MERVQGDGFLWKRQNENEEKPWFGRAKAKKNRGGRKKRQKTLQIFSWLSRPFSDSLKKARTSYDGVRDGLGRRRRHDDLLLLVRRLRRGPASGAGGASADDVDGPDSLLLCFVHFFPLLFFFFFLLLVLERAGRVPFHSFSRALSSLCTE